MRAVLDTNVLVSAVIQPAGKPAQILRQAAAGFELICSAYILAELADVLGRPHIQKRYTALVTAERRAQFMALLGALALSPEVTTVLEIVTDAADNQVLAAAVDGQADYLVTGDPHLLGINHYAGCQIVTPDGFIRILAEPTSTG
jgi:uncharacterized protein